MYLCKWAGFNALKKVLIESFMSSRFFVDLLFMNFLSDAQKSSITLISGELAGITSFKKMQIIKKN